MIAPNRMNNVQGQDMKCPQCWAVDEARRRWDTSSGKLFRFELPGNPEEYGPWVPFTGCEDIDDKLEDMPGAFFSDWASASFHCNGCINLFCNDCGRIDKYGLNTYQCGSCRTYKHMMKIVNIYVHLLTMAIDIDNK